MFINLYGAHTPIRAAPPKPEQLQLIQERLPLHTARAPVHYWPQGGRPHPGPPPPGKPSATLSPLQRAVDWSHARSGGHKIIVPPAPENPGYYELKCPLILPYSPGPGTPNPVGIEIEGHGFRDSNGSSSKVRFVYAGKQTGVEMVVSMFQSGHVANLDFHDLHEKCRYGLALCDFHGGQSFTSHWDHISASARAEGGVGFIINHTSAASGHPASEQYFYHATFSGRAWGAEIHGAQTTNILFERETSFHSAGGGPVGADENYRTLNSLFGHKPTGGKWQSADSGDLRVFGTIVRIGDGYSFARGHYVFFLSNEQGHPQAGLSGDLYLRNWYTEAEKGVFLIYASGLDTHGTRILAEGTYLYQHDQHPFYTLYTNNRSRIQWNNSSSMGAGWILLDYVNPNGEGPTWVRIGNDFYGKKFRTKAASPPEQALHVNGQVRLGDGVLFSEGGSLKWRKPDGTVVALA